MQPLGEGIIQSLQDISKCVRGFERGNVESIAQVGAALEAVSIEIQEDCGLFCIINHCLEALRLLFFNLESDLQSLITAIADSVDQIIIDMCSADADAYESIIIDSSEVLSSVIAKSTKIINCVGDCPTPETDKSTPEPPRSNLTPYEELLLPEIDSELLSEFITECRDYIEGSEAALLSLEVDLQDTEAVNTVSHAFHTINGTSAFLGIEQVSKLAHKAESLGGTFVKTPGISGGAIMGNGRVGLIPDTAKITILARQLPSGTSHRNNQLLAAK